MTKKLLMILVVASFYCLPQASGDVYLQAQTQSTAISDPAELESEEIPGAWVGDDKTSNLPESMQLTWVTQVKSSWLRANFDLNPNGMLLDFRETETITALDLDWSPQLTETVSFRSRGLLSYGRFDEKEEGESYLLEGYLQWKNSNQSLVADAGKIRVEWGSGYAWNPTRVIRMPVDESNSLVDDHEGVGMIRVVWYREPFTLIAIVADLRKTDSDEEAPIQSALKGALNLDPWEIEIISYQATKHADVRGLSFSGLLSDSLEIHGEWSRTKKRDRTRIEKAADGINMGSAYLPARYTYVRDDRDIDFDRILLGGQFTFSGDMNVILEFYHTTHGYDDHEWQDAEHGIDEALHGDAWSNPHAPFTTADGNPYAGFLMNTASAIGNEQLRQNYLFLRFTSGKFCNNWEWEQILMLNLDDESRLHQAILNKSWLDTINSSLELTLFRGNNRSEFGLNPYGESLALTVGYHF